MELERKYLRKIGIKVMGRGPMYVDLSCYFDGVEYSLIKLGEDTVISREVMFLIHDYSISRGLQAIDKLKKEIRLVKGISIGNNSFIGARVSLLPGTIIGDNVIIGAGSVVKGNIPDNSVVVGNPAAIIADTRDWGEKQYKIFYGENEG